MRTSVLLGGGLLLMVIARSGFGQSTLGPPTLRPNSRPTTSPYLFLSGGRRSNTALNYYRQVRPQQNFLATSQRQARTLNALGRDLSQIQEQSLAPERPLIGPTGHTTTFFNYGSYFGGSPSAVGLGRR